jgi:Ca-activated chloride channel family protein
VVDISGSMHGFPLDTAKVLMRQLLGGLRPSDSFNVMLFSGSARTLAHESVPATQANVNAALQMLRQTAGGGGTEIVPALQAVAALPKRDDVSRTVVVVTDGYVAVEREVFQLVRNQLDRSNVFAFGIGSSVNRHLIEGIARAGQGEPFVITKPAQAAAEAERFRRMVEAPVLTQVKVRFDGLQAYDVEPARLPDVLGGRPVVVVGKWKGEPRGTLTVEGRNAEGPQAVALDVAAARSRDTGALRQLWARQRIATLADEEALVGGQPHKEAITRMGLRYSLLTDHTSFIAVDHRVRNTGSQADAVDQPSPLPEGVSELAVGAHVPSTPEPTFWAAAIAMLMVLGITLRRRTPARH